VTIRAAKPSDADRIREFLTASSGESRYRRFQKWVEAPSEALAHSLTDMDDRTGPALVATVAAPSGEAIVAEARCVAHPNGESCDLGLLVEDDWQKTGVAGLLMEALIEAARDQGLAAIEGLVLKSNAPMLRFVRAFGFAIEPIEEDRTMLYIRRGLRDSPEPGSASAAGRPSEARR
jgi:acetyltransferase